MELKEYISQYSDLVNQKNEMQSSREAAFDVDPYLASLMGSDAMLAAIEQKILEVKEDAWSFMDQAAEGRLSARLDTIGTNIQTNPAFLHAINAAKSTGETDESISFNIAFTNPDFVGYTNTLETAEEKEFATEIIADKVVGLLTTIESTTESGVQQIPDTENNEQDAFVQDTGSPRFRRRRIRRREVERREDSAYIFTDGTDLIVGDTLHELQNNNEATMIVNALLEAKGTPLNPEQIYQAAGIPELYESTWPRVRILLKNILGEYSYDVKKDPNRTKNPRPRYVLLSEQELELIKDARAARDAGEQVPTDLEILNISEEVQKEVDIDAGELSVFEVGMLLAQIRNADTSLKGTKFEGFFGDYNWILVEQIEPLIALAYKDKKLEQSKLSLTDIERKTIREAARQKIKDMLKLKPKEFEALTYGGSLPEVVSYALIYFKDQQEALVLAQTMADRSPGVVSQVRIGRGVGNIGEVVDSFLEDSEGNRDNLVTLLEDAGLDPEKVQEAREQVQEERKIKEDHDVVIQDNVIVISASSSGNIEQHRAPHGESLVIRAKRELNEKIGDLDEILDGIVEKLDSKNALGSLDRAYTVRQMSTITGLADNLVEDIFKDVLKKEVYSGTMSLREMYMYYLTKTYRRRTLGNLLTHPTKRKKEAYEQAVLEMIDARIKTRLDARTKEDKKS